MSVMDTFYRWARRGHIGHESNARDEFYREWDRQRAAAISPRDRDEIDAIFSRNL